MADPSLTLRSGSPELRLEPAIGGAIAGFDWLDGHGRAPILRVGRDSPEKRRGEARDAARGLAEIAGGDGVRWTYSHSDLIV